MKKITMLSLFMSGLLALAQPTTNAPVPTRAAADVVSIFSDSYANIATNYNPNWGQSGTVNPAFVAVASSGNNVMSYTNFNYQGTELTASNLSAMEFLHVDIWTNATAGSVIQVTPVNFGTGAQETLVTINHTQGGWLSVDIPKSAFTGMTWNNVSQMKFAANGLGSVVPIDIYLDNIYFWKNAVNPDDDANLSSLSVNGTPIAGFSPATQVYNVPLMNGTTTVPTVTAVTSNANANAAITQAPGLPGTATVVVTAVNTAITRTYTVNFSVVGPSVAAPTPPNRAPADVKSIFSDHYAAIVPSMNYQGIDGQPSNDNTFNTSWCPANTTLVQVQGNNTNLVTGLGCEGISFLAGRFDATTFTHFHMDIFTDTDTMDKSFNMKFSNWNGGAGEANAIEYSANNSNLLPASNPGTWISFDIPLSQFAIAGGGSANRNDLVQFVITSNLGTVYYDNLYLHKNTVLSNGSFKVSSLKMYPNPAQDMLYFSADSPVSNVRVFNIMGQQVLARNNEVSEINVSGLNAGVYFVKATTEGVEVTEKFIKK